MMIEAASEETRKAYGAEMRETQLAFEAAFGNVSKIQDINDPFLIKCFRYSDAYTTTFNLMKL